MSFGVRVTDVRLRSSRAGSRSWILESGRTPAMSVSELQRGGFMINPLRPGEISSSAFEVESPPRLVQVMNPVDGRNVSIFQTPVYLDKGVRVMVRYSQAFLRGESARGTDLSRRRELLLKDRNNSTRLPPRRCGKKSGNFIFNLTGVRQISKIKLNPCLGGVNCLSGMSSRIFSDATVTKQEVVATAEAACCCTLCLALAESLLERELVLLKEVCK
jgi:hypothetical protein